jgi:hypothetical protein
MFVKQLLDTMNLKIQYPITIHVDNIKAINLSRNFSLSQNTNYFDKRRHFVREFQDQGIIKTCFGSKQNNEADFHTKNSSEDTFIRDTMKHQQNLETTK